jgi:hypothetical protein
MNVERYRQVIERMVFFVNLLTRRSAYCTVSLCRSHSGQVHWCKTAGLAYCILCCILCRKNIQLNPGGGGWRGVEEGWTSLFGSTQDQISRVFGDPWRNEWMSSWANSPDLGWGSGIQSQPEILYIKKPAKELFGIMKILFWGLVTKF